MNIKYLILIIVCCGLTVVRSDAQTANVAVGQGSMQIISHDYQSLFSDQFDFGSYLKKPFSTHSSLFKYDTKLNHLPGLFCKLEYKIETKSKLAPRFRLGSLQYTEWMEGKRNFYMHY